MNKAACPAELLLCHFEYMLWEIVCDNLVFSKKKVPKH